MGSKANRKLTVGTNKATGAVVVTQTKRAEPVSYKYEIAELADALGVKPSSARIRLRQAKVKKAGRAYGWNSKAEFEAVLKQLKNAPVKKRGRPRAEDDDDAIEVEEDEEEE